MIDVLLMMLIDDLKRAGLAAKIEQPLSPSHSEVLVISVNARPVRFVVTRRLRAPYPSEIAQLITTKRVLARQGAPLLIAPSVSAPVGQLLVDAGWSWADECGSYDIRHGSIILRQTVTEALPVSRPRVGIPQGRGSLAMVRHLLTTAGPTEPVTATALAKAAGASQAAASQLLGALEKSSSVERRGRSAWSPNRERLLDQFLATYVGPRGAEQYFYTLESLHDAARAVVKLSHAKNVSAVISADVGPDILAPWRVPTMAVIYTSSPVDLDGLKMVPAQDRSDANIILRQPHDASIFGTVSTSGTLPLSDVPQMLWDLHNLGGGDREEAADKLRQWLLHR